LTKNRLIALVALAMGGAVSAALLILANPARDTVDVYAVAHDIPAGATITADSLRVEPVVIASGVASLFTLGDETQVVGLHAGHGLSAGQLLQRGDVIAAGTVADERLVFVPVKDAPPALPGSRLDLLIIGGTADHPAVIPFAIGVEVRAVVPSGFIVAVPSKQASAFVYAAEVMRLAAVIAAPGAAVGSESPIGAPDQAMAVAAQP
jgi:SAF domain-containing protein